MHSSSPPAPRELTGAALPFGVHDLADPPERLFLTGVLPAGPRVAVVGTRRPTPEAYRFAQELAQELSRAGVVVVSGGATGIDTAAHEGALAAGAGTLVVAPSSYCCPYPEQNRALFRRIVDSDGGYLTMFDRPTVARRHVFFSRNALLVSVCLAVVLVQAPYRSGARNATLWARRLGRPYWVVPHAPWCSSGAASAAELRLGGKPLAQAGEVLAWLAASQVTTVPLETPRVDAESSKRPSSAPEAVSVEDREPKHEASSGSGQGKPGRRVSAMSRPHPRLQAVDGPGSEDLARLMAVLQSGPKHPDELCVLLDWPPAHLQATVLAATLLGEVWRNEAGRIEARNGHRGRG